MRGALFMATSMAGYVFNDALMKSLSEDMSMGQAIFLRGIFASLLIVALARRTGTWRPLSVALQPMPFLRTACEVMATILFLTALVYVQFAIASAILQALPLAVTVGAALFLKERVGWRRWVAILAGFCGVIVIIQPGFSGYSPYALLIVLAVVCAAARDLATRATPAGIPSLFLAAITAPAVAVAGLGMWIWDGSIAPVTAIHLLKILGASVFILVGYQFIVMAMREGDIAFIAPFRYTSLLWAILLGILIFAEYPDWLTILGSATVVATGVYTLYREHRLTSRH